jgi:hypothetical protein
VRPTIYTASILSEAGTGTGARAPGSRVDLIRADGLGSSKNPENFRVRLELYMIKARSQIVIYVAKHPQQEALAQAHSS